MYLLSHELAVSIRSASFSQEQYTLLIFGLEITKISSRLVTGEKIGTMVKRFPRTG